ncbi:hypothetical protein NM688_g7071 [Phlebia brevispora]|uniref:Uncharacterized protein n=1 Tax=Phlebia brevispora TaxID=194682 RepID=A0ACC1S9V1_9APHY|nr:hypothetical protein NM688_g7071 [Phlebia brevispora]
MVWTSRRPTNSRQRSVATTSTKPPSVIKQDIKRVLDRMQIQYRETRTGYECIHVPSIDVNSVLDSPTPQRGHRKQGSSGSAETETTRKSIGRKSSKLSFGKKSRDREKTSETKEKELPSRPSGGTVLSMTPSSASSSFFHVSSNTHGNADAARSDTLEATTSHGEESSVRPNSPTTPQNITPYTPRLRIDTTNCTAVPYWPDGQRSIRVHWHKFALGPVRDQHSQGSLAPTSWDTVQTFQR